MLFIRFKQLCIQNELDYKPKHDIRNEMPDLVNSYKMLYLK